MSSKENMRQSNFELMRIVSMFMIIIWHILIHGEVINNTAYTSNIFFRIITCFLAVHVNSFILLSGYFGYNKDLKVTKVIKLNNSMWFYTLLFVIIFRCFNLYDINNLEIFKAILPIPFNDYWFMTDYLILYLMSPALNTIINNTNQEKLRKILISSFILLSVLPWLTGMKFFDINYGLNLLHFFLLYLLGGYLRLYPIEKNIHFKNYSNNKIKLIAFTFYVILCLSGYFIHLFGDILLKTESTTLMDIGWNFYVGIQSYANPLVVLATVSYFIYFSKLNIKSKFINRISACTLGIYLIHDNGYVRKFIYKFLGFNKSVYGLKSLGMILGSAIIIFICSLIIELIRQLIFKFIYDRKISGKFRKKCRNYFESLGWNINW